MELVPIERDGRLGGAVEPPAELADVLPAYAGLYAAEGFEPPWIGYVALEGGTCVGTCGFKTPPREGRAELAYWTFGAHEGRGVATRMARALVERSRAADPTLAVAAQTLPQEGASTAILRKLGFRLVGTVEHPEDGPVWEWRLDAGEGPAAP